MGSITWLADALRAAGLDVVEHANWQTRERPGNWDPRFIVVHATAAPRSQDDDTQVRVVRDGRADLRGPIANACIDRRGRWHVLSAGRCNTTVTGTAGQFGGLGNTHALGIEACNDNGLGSPPEAWPDVQYRSYVRGVAAICKRMGWPASRAVGHKEHTPGHKTDPTFSMSRFRADVAAALAGNLEEDDVSQADVISAFRQPELQELVKDLISQALHGENVGGSGTTYAVMMQRIYNTVLAEAARDEEALQRLLVALQQTSAIDVTALAAAMAPALAAQIVPRLPATALTEDQVREATEAGLRNVLRQGTDSI